MPSLTVQLLALLIGVCLLVDPTVSPTIATNENQNDYSKGLKRVDIGVGCSNAAIYRYKADQKGPYYETTVTDNEAQFLSFRFDYFNLPEGDYLKIFGTNDTSKTPIVLTYSQQNYSNVTTPITTQSATIQLYTTRPLGMLRHGACPGFHIQAYYYFAHLGSLNNDSKEAVCGSDDTEEIACYKGRPSIYNQAKAVMRLTIAKPNGLFYCTGWLLGSKGHMLTNHHCIAEQVHADNMKVEALASGAQCSTRCDSGGACAGYVIATSGEVVATSAEHDFTLIKLHTGIDLPATFGYLQLRMTGAELAEQIYLIHHPSGWGTRTSYKDGSDYGKVLSVTQNTYSCGLNQVSYALDTAGGSSGAPVIGMKDHAVVALHHCGRKCKNSAINSNVLVRALIDMQRLPYCSLSTDQGCP